MNAHPSNSQISIRCSLLSVKTPSLASVFFIYIIPLICVNVVTAQNSFIACQCASLSRELVADRLRARVVAVRHRKMFEEDDAYVTPDPSNSSSSRSSYLSAVEYSNCPFCQSERLDEKRLAAGIVIITCHDCGCSSVPSIDDSSSSSSGSNIVQCLSPDSSFQVRHAHPHGL